MGGTPTRHLFDAASASSADLPPGVLLPRDVFPAIFRHLSQEGLCACLRVCKAFYHMITSDEVLLARLQIVHSYHQFKSYLEVGRPYYHGEYYSNIGQNDDAKFPYCEQFEVKGLTHRDEPEMHMSYASVTAPGKSPRCTGSRLFSAKYMLEQEDVYGVNKYDVMLTLLEKLWKYVTNPDRTGLLTRMPFVNKNMRKAIKKLKRHLKENPKFGEFAVLQAGHTQWYKDVMGLRPEDEPESSSDEELSQEIEEEQVSKLPVYYCKRCKWRMGGFICRKSLEGGVCGELLVLQQDASLRCPKGCGVMSVPICCRRRAMKAVVLPGFGVSAQSNMTCPVFSCEKCKFGVDGIRCFTCTPTGKEVERNGFFERVWCAYVWTCPSGCGRKDRGGLVHDGIVRCMCQRGEGTPMQAHQYVKKHGPPRN